MQFAFSEPPDGAAVGNSPTVNPPDAPEQRPSVVPNEYIVVFDPDMFDYDKKAKKARTNDRAPRGRGQTVREIAQDFVDKADLDTPPGHAIKAAIFSSYEHTIRGFAVRLSPQAKAALEKMRL